jgi:hypothetical protein
MKEKLMEALARTVALKAESNERMEKIGAAKRDMHDAACIGADHFREQAESGHEGAQVAYMNLQRSKKMME